MRRPLLRSSGVALLLWASPFVLSSPAGAQTPDPAPGRPAPSRVPAPDFLLKRPVGSVAVRGGWVFARAGSDLFSFLEDTLTIDKGDFRAPAVAADVAYAVTPRIDVVFGVEYGRASIQSEYRDLVDNNFLPIEQKTELAAAHITGEIRYALLPRGDAVSRLAWVPRRAVPYVGAGAGAVRYRLVQSGDFVDYADQSVFSDVLISGGWAPTVHAFGGVDLHVRRGLFATLEARYVWADVPLDPSFVDFDPIDLAGFRTSAGIRLVF